MKGRIIILVILASVVGTLHAGVIDQVQLQSQVTGTICSEWHWAQTFTPGITSQLESVDLYLSNFEMDLPDPPTYLSTISIVNVIGTVPSGSVLGEVYVEQFVNGFNRVDFLSESVFLTAGSLYGIVVSNDDSEPFDNGSLSWGLTEGGDVYTDGSLWLWKADVGWNQDYLLPDYDFSLMDAGFATYMVPEPSSIVLWGLAALCMKRRSHSVATLTAQK
ncbi:MAG: hypothetical protein KAV87_61955 [Desulfobacteraceae bacterium]|nr:hypothetical protein [Desulfobacteraceae bacterium]